MTLRISGLLTRAKIFTAVTILIRDVQRDLTIEQLLQLNAISTAAAFIGLIPGLETIRFIWLASNLCCLWTENPGQRPPKSKNFCRLIRQCSRLGVAAEPDRR